MGKTNELPFWEIPDNARWIALRARKGVRKHLSELAHARKLYEFTKNPLYAMVAIHIASKRNTKAAEGIDPTSAIPDWCLPWLHEAMGSVLAIAKDVQRRGATVAEETRARRAVTPRVAARQVPQALGLTRQGKNSFRDFSVDQADIALVQLLEFERDLESIENTPPKRLEELKRSLGAIREDGVIRKRIRRGRKMLPYEDLDDRKVSDGRAGQGGDAGSDGIDL